MSLKECVRRQQTIAGETYRYLRRDFSKYFLGAVGMRAVFGINLEMTDAYCSTYYFFRHLDDILDGDRAISENPQTYAVDIRSSIEKGTYDFYRYPILRLAARSIEHFDKVKRLEDHPRDEMLGLIDAMMYDHERMQTRQALPNDQLLASYRQQFNPIINLQFICLDSNLRVGDIPDFPILQARVYSLIDMEADWNRGLINVPSEVLQEANLNTFDSFETVSKSSVVREWVQSECRECHDQLNRVNSTLTEILSTPNEKYVRIILLSLIDKITKFVDRNI